MGAVFSYFRSARNTAIVIFDVNLQLSSLINVGKMASVVFGFLPGSTLSLISSSVASSVVSPTPSPESRLRIPCTAILGSLCTPVSFMSKLASELVPWVEWEDGMAVGSRTPLAGAVKMAASLLQVRWVVLQELECSSLRGQVPLCSCLRFEAVLAELSSRRRQDLLVVFFSSSVISLDHVLQK